MEAGAVGHGGVDGPLLLRRPAIARHRSAFPVSFNDVNIEEPGQVYTDW
jgi:hypothetical protein